MTGLIFHIFTFSLCQCFMERNLGPVRICCTQANFLPFVSASLVLFWVEGYCDGCQVVLANSILPYPFINYCKEDSSPSPHFVVVIDIYIVAFSYNPTIQLICSKCPHLVVGCLSSKLLWFLPIPNCIFIISVFMGRLL